MGRDVARQSFTRRERQQYRGRVHRCLNALAMMLREGAFAGDVEATIGLEVELNLIDHRFEPAMRNTAVLDGVDTPELTSELGRWNVELNLPPRSLPGEQVRYLENHLLDLISQIEKKAETVGAKVLAIGILPTLSEDDLTTDLLSPSNRFAVLNEQILSARGEPVRLDIDATGTAADQDNEQTFATAGTGLGGFGWSDGARADQDGNEPAAGRWHRDTAVGAGDRCAVPAERLQMDFDSIAPEAACTSLQLHLQVPPDAFAANWNAAQSVAGIQLAVGSNSPFLLGRRLWAETRVPLFLQATDVRTPELRNQGVRPRVWFGERWINSIFELFEENVRYFPGLLPVAGTQDPQVELAEGRVPTLEELRLHNGTIWRWNRPIYDVADGMPHLRVENRVLPAGPSVLDMIANAVFFYGLLRVLTEQDRPVWANMPFSAAEENFMRAARDGMDTTLYWPDDGWIAPDQLVLHRLLPMAADGLANWGVTDAVSGRYLDVIERRCATRRTGSAWQVHTVGALEEAGADRPAALRGMLERYLDGMTCNAPVHTWPLPR
ncbi:MAG TPA: glutamate--cysteine ligase [Pseudonocardia sp.]|uniref:glutamate--cysteine ligase n=1 Tax=Pseudonocardia sp. TaxID=60912 RepID=UPI002F3EFE5F